MFRSSLTLLSSAIAARCTKPMCFVERDGTKVSRKLGADPERRIALLLWRLC